MNITVKSGAVNYCQGDYATKRPAKPVHSRIVLQKNFTKDRKETFVEIGAFCVGERMCQVARTELIPGCEISFVQPQSSFPYAGRPPGSLHEETWQKALPVRVVNRFVISPLSYLKPRQKSRRSSSRSSVIQPGNGLLSCWKSTMIGDCVYLR